MGKLIIFAILAVIILSSAVFCVSTKRIMRAATALLFVLFGVAGLYFLLDYALPWGQHRLVFMRRYNGNVYLCNPVG